LQKFSGARSLKNAKNTMGRWNARIRRIGADFLRFEEFLTTKTQRFKGKRQKLKGKN
jgi:hypothetical protein